MGRVARAASWRGTAAAHAGDRGAHGGVAARASGSSAPPSAASDTTNAHATGSRPGRAAPGRSAQPGRASRADALTCCPGGTRAHPRGCTRTPCTTAACAGTPRACAARTLTQCR